MARAFKGTLAVIGQNRSVWSTEATAGGHYPHRHRPRSCLAAVSFAAAPSTVKRARSQAHGARRRAHRDPLQLLSVTTESGDTPIPCVGRRRGRGLRPIVIRPAALPVLGIGAELRDILLGDAKVLEQLPDGVGKSQGYLSPKMGRKTGDNLVEAGMRVVPVEQTSKARADLRVLLRSRSPCQGTPPDEARVRSRARLRR